MHIPHNSELLELFLTDFFSFRWNIYFKIIMLCDISYDFWGNFGHIPLEYYQNKIVWPQKSFWLFSKTFIRYQKAAILESPLAATRWQISIVCWQIWIPHTKNRLYEQRHKIAKILQVTYDIFDLLSPLYEI